MAAYRILLLSDTHLFGDHTHHYGVADTEEHLRHALELVAHRSFDLVVCAGDVSEDGSEESYRKAAGILDGWAGERGLRVIWAMGNHDLRAPFRAVLGAGQPGIPLQAPEGADPSRPVVSVALADGWRTIVLDSSVPGRGYGELDEAQLAFLREALREPAPRGSIVVVHHPPVAAQTELLQALALDAPERLFEAVRGSDVRAILSGHYHLPLVELVEGIPVIVAPGVANVARPVADPAEESSVDAVGGMIVELDAGRVRAVPFLERTGGDPEVFRFSSDTARDIAASAGRQGGSPAL